MRDNRIRSHMDRDTQWVHDRITAWGKWVKSNEVHPWPTTTLLGRIIEQGANGAAQGGKPPEMPRDIEIVEIGILRLPATDRHVCITYYTLWEPPEVVARKVRMSPRQMQASLYRSRVRIGAYIDSAENNLYACTV